MKDFLKETIFPVLFVGTVLSCIIIYFSATMYGLVTILLFWGTLPIIIGFPLTVFTLIFGIIFIFGTLGLFIQWINK